MMLDSFEILPQGGDGWTSGVLRFGQNTTLLLGANGAGKTPVMRALAFALGQPVQLPPLIREKCAGARVTLTNDQRRLTVERSFDTRQWQVNDGAIRSTIDSEKEFAELLLPKLGVELRTLRGKNDQPVPPYLSILGPMFVVDQDAGWLSGYVPFETHSFVKDQEEEVLRWVLDLPQRHRVVDKSDYEKAQVRLSSIQMQIRVKRDAIASMSESLGSDRGPDALQRLRDRRELLEGEYKQVLQTVGVPTVNTSERDTTAAQLRDVRQALSYKLINLKRRRAQLIGVQSELGAEMQALEQNETAAEAFRMLCGAAACQLFRKPEESYGRRVLYIKDQLKDFASNSGEVEHEISLLEDQLAAAERDLKASAMQQREQSDTPAATGVLASLQRLTQEVADVRMRIESIDRISLVRGDLEQLLTQEQKAVDDLESLRPTRGPRKDQGRTLDARSTLASAFKEWITVMRTPNVSHDVSVDDQLHFVIGAEQFRSGSSQSGSTRTRLVLAFHASVLEVSINMDGSHPRLLILDAPRQHELSADDLRAFVEHFCTSARASWKKSSQLVFSATDPRVAPEDCIDMLWEPTFKFGEELRFLGPISDVVPTKQVRTTL